MEKSTEDVPLKKAPSVQELKIMAMNSAMYEILHEQREELLKRTRAKLQAMGVQIGKQEIPEAAPEK